MIRIFTITFILFIFQILLLNSYNDIILTKFSSINNIAYEKTQRSIFNILTEIDSANKNNEKKIYIFGASSTREFIPLESDINQKFSQYETIVATTSSQPLLTSLALIEQINVPDTTIILGITPKKYWSENIEYLKNMYCKSGDQLKYPVQSQYVADLYFKYFNDTCFLPSSVYTFTELLKSYTLEQFKNIKRYGINGFKFIDNSPILQHYQRYTHKLSFEELKVLEKKFFNDVLISYENIHQNMEYSFEILKSIVSVAKEKKLKLVLFDIPLNGLFVELYKEELKIYNEQLTSLNTKRVIFNQIVKDASLFHDTSHLNENGKLFYRKYFNKGFGYAISK